MVLKSLLIRTVGKVAMKPVARMTRGMTLGSRVMVIDPAGAVLLVKQTYSTHWILPGGGVERGETLEEAGVRELREESGIEALGPLQLHGIFSNHRIFPGDHVACYVLREFKQQPWKPDQEIEDARFFDRQNLPQLTNAGSRARIAEVLDSAPVSPYWSEP